MTAHPTASRSRRFRQPDRKRVLLALGWYVHEMVVGVAKYAREAHWVLDDVPSHAGRPPRSWQGDGIIGLFSSEAHRPLIDWVRHCRCPVVDLSDQLPELPFPRVLPDNNAIGRMAADHLLRQGFGHLAYFAVDLDAPVVRERYEGFGARVREAGRTLHLVDYTELARKEGAMDRMLPWLARQLARLPKPLGAMAQYDRESMDIVRAAHLAGLPVPEQVAVVGVDNDPIYCELGPIPLSSVASNREMIGYKGAELLDRLMRGESPPAQPIRIPPTGLVVRKSSDIVAVNDAQVAKALNFIATQFRESITVADVVRVSGASRRSLYLKFASEVGHSIHREILRQRLDRAKHLLRETDGKLHAVARESGFEDAGILSKAFRQHLGVSASSFRAQQQPRKPPVARTGRCSARGTVDPV